MPEIVLEVGGSKIRADYLLVVLSIIIVAIISLVWTWARSVRIRKESIASFDQLSQLLSKPEVVDLLKSNNFTLKDLTENLRSVNKSNDKSSNLFIGGPWLSKISNDITWDIAGLIGLGVTIVLLFMMVSGTIDKVPEKIYTVWLMIISYYFGKTQQTRHS